VNADSYIAFGARIHRICSAAGISPGRKAATVNCDHQYQDEKDRED
jgi:hypothetical protein